MTMRQTRRSIRYGAAMLAVAGLASCVAPPKPAPAPPAPPPPALALPAAPPQQDWRDVPLTPGNWTWRGGAGQSSIAQYGLAGQGAQFALRCDLATRAVIFSRGSGSTATVASSMGFTTSFGLFSLAASYGGGQPPAIVAQASARDPRLDQIAFSRGRFLVDVAGQPRLVLPAWPEVARVIEDCRC